MKRIQRRKFVNHKKRIMYFSIFFMLFFISIGYAYMNTTLSINSHVVLSANHSTAVDALVQDLKTNNSSCFTKYEGEVTDQVGQTVTAQNVYFNQCADKRNIIFGGFCWQMIRTTETGGIKMIYNGEAVNGKCEGTRGAHKGIVQINNTNQVLNSSYLYGSSFTYDINTNEFTLVDTISATWSDSTYEDLIGKFTCKSTSDICTTIYQINGYSSNTEGYTSSYIIDNTNYAGIGTSSFNALTHSPAMVGYMFNKVYKNTNNAPVSGMLTGNDVTYSNGVYTLLPASGEGTLGTILDNVHHYTCNNTTGTCNKVRYYYYEDYYIELDGEANIEEAINNMLYDDNVNRYNSSIKGIIDAWYAENLSSKTSMIEDTVYCNARNIINQNNNGWNKDGDLTIFMSFKNDSLNGDLSCPYETDQFAVENTNAKLTYPVALVTNEELYKLTNNNSISYYEFFTKTNTAWWNLSPSYFYISDASVRGVLSVGSLNVFFVGDANSVRPSISLNSSVAITEGDGSEESPFIISE